MHKAHRIVLGILLDTNSPGEVEKGGKHAESRPPSRVPEFYPQTTKLYTSNQACDAYL